MNARVLAVCALLAAPAAVFAEDPQDLLVQARTSAWSGHTDRAVVLYRRYLAEEPTAAAAWAS